MAASFASITLVDWKRQNPPKSAEFDWEMYRYVPSLAGAIVCLVVFFAMAVLHARQFWQSGNRIVVFVVVGALCVYYPLPSFPLLSRTNKQKGTWLIHFDSTIGEVGGYGARIASHFDNEAWGPFITQGVLTLIGPLWFAATIYMMLGRTIRLAGGEDVSFIPARWYTRIFVTADVSTLVIQGLGEFFSFASKHKVEVRELVCTDWLLFVLFRFQYHGHHATLPRSRGRENRHRWSRASSRYFCRFPRRVHRLPDPHESQGDWVVCTASDRCFTLEENVVYPL